jgi:hypothetical protein
MVGCITCRARQDQHLRRSSTAHPPIHCTENLEAVSDYAGGSSVDSDPPMRMRLPYTVEGVDPQAEWTKIHPVAGRIGRRSTAFA